MKQQLWNHFLLYDYEQQLYVQYQQCLQRTRTINAYTEDFYRLCARNNIRESHNQVIVRYIGGLNSTIRDKLELSSIWTIIHAVYLAIKVESQLMRNLKSMTYRKNTWDNSKNPYNSSKIGKTNIWRSGLSESIQHKWSSSSTGQAITPESKINF